MYNDEGEFVLSSYGPENTEFSQIKKNKDFINSVLTDKARRNPELKPLSNDCP